MRRAVSMSTSQQCDELAQVGQAMRMAPTVSTLDGFGDAHGLTILHPLSVDNARVSHRISRAG